MKIALGSTSNAKINILKETLAPMIKDKLIIKSVDVDSGITDQPLDEKTTTQGAINRAKRAIEKSNNINFSVGLEGGLHEINNKGYFLVCVAAIVDLEGNTFIGVGSKLQLPRDVSDQIKKGDQFGEVIREYEITHKQNKKMRQLVQELITRKSAFEQAITNAYLSYVGPT